ncbi:MAG: hypothetical protein ACJ74R_01215 [Gaiellaceae bacterium]|jgi:hypothetical protein
MTSPVDVADIVGGTKDRIFEMEVEMSGWWLGSILLFIVWVAIAFWPARVAARKGHSFFGYFLFSLFFFPLALFVAYMVGDRRVYA